MEDHDLLREYAEHGSERGFAELVGRYLALVYSAAKRVVGEEHLAKDVAQSVFLRLARKAGSLPKDVVLAAWLHRHTHFAACNALRHERRQREHAAAAMELNSLSNDSESLWPQLAPSLDEALSHLGRKDHQAVVLRFFEGKSLREVGAALSLSEDAAQKRVSRALEKLRVHFAQRGLTVSSAMLVSVIGANAVQAAPAGLASSIVSASLAGTSAALAGGLTFTLIETLAMTKLKTATVAAIALAVVSVPLVLQHRANSRLRQEIRLLQQQIPPATPIRAEPRMLPAPTAATSAPPAKVFDWQTVESTDYRTYIGNLRAIGCPEQTIRDIIRADVKQLFDARVRAQLPAQRFEYWKPGTSIATLVNDDFVNRQKELALEKHALLKELLGTDASAEPDLTAGLHVFDTVLDFMTPETRSKVLEVELLHVGRLVAASDSTSLAKAQAEKEQLLQRILTPEEKFDYDVRLSWTALSLQTRLGEFEPTEQEFREIVRLQKQYDDAFGQSRTANASADERAAAQTELEQQVRGLLGEERYREFRNEEHWIRSSLRGVAEDFNIPKEAAFKVFDLTDLAKEQAERIRADAQLSPGQKQAALDAIRAETERAVSAVIGPEATQTYINGGSTIKGLNRLQ